MDGFMSVLESGSGCEGSLQIFSTKLALIHILDWAWKAKPDYLGGGMDETRPEDEHHVPMDV